MLGELWDFILLYFWFCFIFAFWFLIYFFCGQETYFIWFIPFKFSKSCFVAQDRVYLLNISWTLKKNLYSAVVWGVIATYIKLVDNIVQVFYQFSSVTQLCPTLCDPMNCSMPGLSVHHQLPEFTQLMSIELVMPSNHLILCHPLLLLPSIFPSIRVFSNESALHISWPKYWSFSFNISPSNEHPGPISLRMDWLDLPAVQGTLKSLFQHHISKASILLRSALFIVQLSHPYMSTGKTKFSVVLLIFCLLVFVSYWQKYVQFSK